MANTHDTWTWTTKDGLKLAAQSWTPEGECQAVLCIVHGMGEHAGRYADFAARFNDQGYAVLSYDHRGHGNSDGPRGHTPSYDALLNGVDLLLKEARTHHDGKPCFLWGHSMGGNVVLNYVLRRKPALTGVIVTGPWLRLAKEPPAIQVAFGRIMDRIWPGFGQNTGLNDEFISRDPAAVEAYRNDPLVHYRISAHMFLSCHDAGQYALDHAGEFTLHLLLMHGGADQLTSPEGSRVFNAKAPDCCTYKEWDGCYHELHNEPEKDDVFRAMVDWMQSRIAAPAK